MKRFTPKDCQQGSPDGSKIISIHPGAFVVRVHESRDAVFMQSPHRYYLSVDLKFRERDVLHNGFWMGITKSEATRDANELAAKLTRLAESISHAEASNMVGKDILLQRINTTLSTILARFPAEVIPA